MGGSCKEALRLDIRKDLMYEESESKGKMSHRIIWKTVPKWKGPFPSGDVSSLSPAGTAQLCGCVLEGILLGFYMGLDDC